MRRSENGYSGEANGIRCSIRTEQDTWIVTLSTISDDWGFAEKSISVQVISFDSAEYVISKWIDSECWETVIADPDRDTRYFQTTNGRIAYYAYNTELDSIPVLMIHGGPGGDSNTERARKLMLDHPVYLYDQLGCGRSDPIPNIDEWNEESYFKELEEFIDGMEFKKVILIGASWGAGLSAGYAIRSNCKKIALMILPSPFFSSRQWEEDQRTNLMTLSEECQTLMNDYIAGKGSRADYHKAMKEYYSHFLFSRKCNEEIASMAAEEEQNEVFIKMMGDNDMICRGNMKDFDLVPDLHRITADTLLMCGDSDEVTVDTLCKYQGLIKNSRVCVIPNAGHALSFEQFGMYRQAIIDFLKEEGY